LQLQYESNEYVKNLEKTNLQLKKKLKNYEEIVQGFQKEQKASGKIRRTEHDSVRKENIRIKSLG